MTEAQEKAIRELRDAGYAVILWTPDELDGVDPSDVEEASISFAADYLIPSQDQE